MSKMMVCSVYDRIADSFGENLQLYRNDALAIRDAKAVVLDERTQFSRSAGDYSLWQVAEYETDNGVMSPMERRKIVEFDALKGE